jgi:hypothetical protein
MGEHPARKAFNTIVGALQPLESPDRKRAVLSALHFLEENWVPLPHKKAPEQAGTPQQEKSEASGTFLAGVQAWMKQNDLTSDEVEQVFSFDDGKVSVIVDLPGSSKRDDTIKLYTLMGVGTYLSAGERKFADEAARNGLHRAPMARIGARWWPLLRDRIQHPGRCT